MRSINSLAEFEIMLQKVTNDLKRHTGHSEFDRKTFTITTCSQGQELVVTIVSPVVSDCNNYKYSYYIKLDNIETTGQFHQDELSGVYSHIYGLIINKLGDKVVNSLLK